MKIAILGEAPTGMDRPISLQIILSVELAKMGMK